MGAGSVFSPKYLLTPHPPPPLVYSFKKTGLASRRGFSDRRSAISAFVGMAGAMGALLPSPLLAVLLLHELSITSRPGDTRFNAIVEPNSLTSSFRQSQQISWFEEEDEDEDDDTGYKNEEGRTISNHHPNDIAQHDFMEQVCLGGVSASCAFAIFYGLLKYTWLEESKIPFSLYDIAQEKYEHWWLVAAIPLGIIGGLLGKKKC